MEELIRLEVEGVRFRVGIVRTDKEMYSVLRLRWDVYVSTCDPKPGQIHSKDVPEPFRTLELESDEFDRDAVHLIAEREENGVSRIIGTIRYIRAETGLLLERSKFADWQLTFPALAPTNRVLERDQTFEPSRWIGPLESLPSGKKVQVSMLLIHAGLIVSRRYKRKWWVNAITHKKLVQINDKWPFVEIGPKGPHLYHGTEVTVCVLPVPDSEDLDYGYAAVIP